MTDNEPTEAAVCRMMLADMEDQLSTNRAIKDRESAYMWETKANALRTCMKAAGWSTEEPDNDEQHIWSAG